MITTVGEYTQWRSNGLETYSITEAFMHLLLAIPTGYVAAVHAGGYPGDNVIAAINGVATALNTIIALKEFANTPQQTQIERKLEILDDLKRKIESKNKVTKSDIEEVIYAYEKLDKVANKDKFLGARRRYKDDLDKARTYVEELKKKLKVK